MLIKKIIVHPYSEMCNIFVCLAFFEYKLIFNYLN